MAKLPRKTQKIFCSKPTSENQTSVFGTMKTADKQYSTDVGTLQSNAAYEQGWKSATIASYKPFMEDFNTLNYINTSQLAYLFQQGIPEWDESTAYYKNSFCSYNGDLWKSLIDDNLNNTPLEGESWTLFASGKKSGSGLELCDIGIALYVDETKGLRRRLNGSIMDITSNYQAFLTRLLEIKTTNPDYFTDEATWQSEATLNVDGCVYKFVLNYDSTGTNVVSVRLPKYPDYVEINAGGTLPVVGNEMTLGLTNGTNNGGLYADTNVYFRGITGNYGQNVVSTATGSGNNIIGSLGVTTDPTKSGIQTTLKQTRLKMRYFIQIATGSETENNIINEIELNNPYSLFECKYADHELFNLSWLVSNGSYNGSNAFHPSAYQALLVEKNAEIAIGSTVTLPNGTEYTKQGLSVKLSTETYTDYDFVLNTADETFRLPLKNHTADDGNSVLTLYFYVGETVQNANLIDAGRIGELVATKTDMLQASGAGMPSSRYINLTLGASGSTYTAPANGYFSVGGNFGNVNGYFSLVNKNNATGQVLLTSEAKANGGSFGCFCWVPVKKGDIVLAYYNYSPFSSTESDTPFFIFIYAEGEA